MELRDIRRLSREIIMQIMYSQEMNLQLLDLSDPKGSQQLNIMINAILEANNVDYDEQIVEYVESVTKLMYDNLEEIDKVISSYLSNWKLEELAVIDKIILRLSVCEMKYNDIPSAISINEAIEIGKKFSGEKSGKFINGVLDKIAKDQKRSKISNDE